jgi:hypothetical protein
MVDCCCATWVEFWYLYHFHYVPILVPIWYALGSSLFVSLELSCSCAYLRAYLAWYIQLLYTPYKVAWFRCLLNSVLVGQNIALLVPCIFVWLGSCLSIWTIPVMIMLGTLNWDVVLNLMVYSFWEIDYGKSGICYLDWS